MVVPMVTFSLCTCSFVTHYYFISIGNPSPVTTCIQFFYSKLSYSLLPSVCIPAHHDSCRLYITSFPDFPHML